MRRQKRMAIAGLAFGMAFSLSGCSLLPEEGDVMKAPVIETQEPYEFEMDIVKRENIYDMVYQYFKYVEVGGEKLMFGTAGSVGNIFFEVGDEVKQGDVIAELSYVEDLRGQLEALELTMEKNQKDYETTLQNKDYELRELQAKKRYGVLSKAEYAQAEAALNERYQDRLQNFEDNAIINELKLEQLKRRIKEGSVVCTIDGVVNSFTNLEVGNYVAANRVVAQVVDASACVFEATTDYPEYFHVGDTLELYTSVDNVTYEVEVVSVEGQLVQLSPIAKDVVIAVNSQARFNLVLDKRENVLTLSATCVRYENDVPYVYYINDEGIRSMKTISIGMKGALEGTSAKNRVEITGGLELGDIVIKK